MRFMIVVKATKDSEAGVMPHEKILGEMAKYHEELQKAGVLLDASGLQATSKGWRIKYSGQKRTVIDGPFTEAKELIAAYTIIQVEATELISYGIPAFKHHRMLVYYAAFRDHCSLFGVGTALMRKHQKALAPYKMSKGTIQFTVEKPLPTALVRKLVKARIAQNEARR